MDKDELDKYIIAGKVAFDAIQLGKSLIRPDASMIGILDELEKFIYSKDAVPAFPAQISLNSTAAHYCPSDNDVTLKEGDIVKLDIGVSVDGYIADTAYTVDLGKNKELVDASRKALSNALKKIKPGIALGEIGATIQEAITSKGYSPIKNLSGHGLGRYRIHGPPTIPNFDTHDRTELEYDQIIAVEPFATDGAGMVYESSNPTLFSLIEERPVRSMMTRQVLSEVKRYNGLPFTTRWLTKKFGLGTTMFALREMNSFNMVESHPPLIEKDKGLVSQAEHSVIVRDNPIIFTKHDDD